MNSISECIQIDAMHYYCKPIIPTQNQLSTSTKIVEQTDYVSNELAIHQMILEIQKHQPNISILHRFSTIHYFNPLSVCNINDKCEFETNENNRSFVMIKYRHNSVYIYDISVFLNNKENRIYIHHILESYRHLLNSFIILNQHSICFFHFSPQSIGFYDIDNPQCFLHGFENSLQISMLSSTYIEMILSRIKQYTFHSFEIHILFYIMKHPEKWLSERTAHIIIQQYVDNMESNMPYIITGFGNKMNYIRKCSDYLFPFLSFSKQKIIQQILKTHSTWDNYSLSILYLHYIQIMINSFNVNIPFLKAFQQIALKNVSPLPTERQSLQQTLRMFQTLFQQYPHWK